AKVQVLFWVATCAGDASGAVSTPAGYQSVPTSPGIGLRLALGGWSEPRRGGGQARGAVERQPCVSTLFSTLPRSVSMVCRAGNRPTIAPPSRPRRVAGLPRLRRSAPAELTYLPEAEERLPSVCGMEQDCRLRSGRAWRRTGGPDLMTRFQTPGLNH